MTAHSIRRTRIARLVTLAVALGIWFAPAPGDLTLDQY